MKILAIETSCDETAISIVEASGPADRPVFTVLAHQVSSQIKLHAEYGGVVPSLAKREHVKNLVPILLEALADSGMLGESQGSPLADTTLLEQILDREPELFSAIETKLLSVTIPDIDLIAVTIGPGLEPALWVGVNFARALSLLWHKPVLGADHMEGHILSPLLVPGTTVQFPTLALLVSGGHTELVLVTDGWNYKKIGQTRDDAVGEAFDKVARLLNLPYPGGPEIGKLAARAEEEHIDTSVWKLPRPMLHSGDFNFSFSGIKTAVLYAIQKHGTMSEADIKAVAKEFQDAIIEVLVTKTLHAITKHNIQTLIIGGGVISNIALRNTFEKILREKHPNVTLLIPEFAHTTDNASMIAAAAYIRQFSQTLTINPPLVANGNLSL